MAGTVVISLDFELGWGHKRIRSEYIEELRNNESKIEPRINALIELFDSYNIGATWGVVGELLRNDEDSLFHNPGLINTLNKSDVDHDIGLHSYSHRSYDNLTRDEAREDLAKGLNALSKFDIDPDSFIFPRNRINHTETLAEVGFKCYRTGRGGRIQNPVTNAVPAIAVPGREEFGLVSVPGSLFLAAPARPVTILRFQAALGLWRAIRNDAIVHFWLHPHNVVTRPEILDLLESTFSKIHDYRNSGDITVKTMTLIAETYSSRGVN